MGLIPRKIIYFLVGVVIFAAAVRIYLPVTEGSFRFVFDDYQYVVENVHVHGGLTWPGVIWALKATYASNWHPLTWISHMLDVTLYGAKPMGHHLTNVLLHALNTVLLLIGLSRLTGCFWRSAFVAAMFGLHPLHVESVAWVAERKDVLSGLFWMISLIAYCAYARKPGALRYMAVLTSFALGLMSKPMVVTLPLALILLDYWSLGRFGSTSGRKLLFEKAPLFVLSAASAAVTVFAQASTGAVAAAASLPLGLRAANALVAYVAYVRKMFWPTDLAVYYTHPVNGIPGWQIVGSAALLVIVTFLAARARGRPYLIVGWLWYLVTLVPVIGLVQVGKQAMADRYTYIPLIGLFIMISWGVPDLLERMLTALKARSAALAAVAVAVTGACAIQTSSQITFWRNEETLFGRALAVTKENWLAHAGLARALDRRGNTRAAVRHYLQSIAIDPTNADVQNGLATALLKLGRTEEAMKHFREAVRLDPNNAAARLHYGVALQQVNPREAEREFRKAVRLQPDNPLAHKNLAAALARRRDFVGAVRHYEIACDLTANTDVSCLVNLAEAYYRLGRKTDAIATARRALRLAEESNQLGTDYIRSRLKVYGQP